MAELVGVMTMSLRPEEGEDGIVRNVFRADIV
jgi:hypothetical protein